MNRILKSLGMLLLLMAAQHGALVHELSHLVSVGSASIYTDAGAADRAPCDLCPAFAQASAPAFSHAFQLPDLDRAAYERLSALPPGLVNASVLDPRSRGPPV